MADKKITDLTNQATQNANDYLEIGNAGSGLARKYLLTNLVPNNEDTTFNAVLTCLDGKGVTLGTGGDCVMTHDGSDTTFTNTTGDMIMIVSENFAIQSTTGAFIPPRMTTTQRNALTGVNGMAIYNSTTNALNAYVGGAWVVINVT